MEPLLASSIFGDSSPDTPGGASAPADPEALPFVSGNPSVELIEGILHLYRTDPRRPKTPTSKAEKGMESDEEKRHDQGPSSVICVLAVPAYMSPPSDFAAFTGGFHRNILHMRVVRDKRRSAASYMVVIKFSSQEAADNFYREFNGKPFNSIEADPELCRLVYVSSIELAKPGAALLLPDGSLELPSCPVCLEQLDEPTTGIMTTLCNHSFHCQCLSKWRSWLHCPVCRFSQQQELPDGPCCSACGTSESLWICLICGNVGCGRFVNEHASDHYRLSGHAYALELQTSRVWDYAGDCYVHRLVNKLEGGEPVALDAKEPNDAASPDVVTKLEGLSLEYMHILEQQQKFFENQLRKLEKEKAMKIQWIEEEYAQLVELKERSEKRLDEERRRWERKAKELEKKARDSVKDVDFLKQINEALEKNQEQWQAKLKDAELQRRGREDEKDKRIQELEDQLKDLMFFIEAKDKIGKEEELQNGQVVMVPAPAPARGSPTAKAAPIGKRKPKP